MKTIQKCLSVIVRGNLSVGLKDGEVRPKEAAYLRYQEISPPGCRDDLELKYDPSLTGERTIISACRSLLWVPALSNGSGNEGEAV